MGGRSAAGKRVRAQAPAARIGFIGGGNMATALIRGFVAAGLYRPDQIVVSGKLGNPSDDRPANAARLTLG